MPTVDQTDIVVATWNTEWAPAKGARTAAVRDRLASTAADILVVTEGRQSLLPDGGHVIDVGDDWGYGVQPDRRKVLIRSRWPVSEVYRATTGGAAGRVATLIAATPEGPIRIVAVCIPWSSAHVSTGRKDATSWSEHLDCLDRLDELAAGFDPAIPTVVAGDFNQRLPRTRQPKAVADRLVDVIGARWTIHTAGDVEHGPLIDHIASDLACTGLSTWPGRTDEIRLSDHSGVACRLVLPTTVRAG